MKSNGVAYWAVDRTTRGDPQQAPISDFLTATDQDAP